jgi:hypothetical protein
MTRIRTGKTPRCLSALALAAALFGVAPTTRAESLGWVPPSRARVVPFSLQTTAPGDAAELDPEKPVPLSPDKVLLVPVEPGDRVRVAGPITGVGLGSGVRETPDVITWMPLPPEEGDPKGRDIDVPTWTAARFLVIRAEKPAEIRVWAASLERSAMRWHRLEEDVGTWLRDPEALPPTSDIPEAQAVVRWLSAARTLAADAPAEAARSWLMTRWIDASIASRPLVEPYFAKRDVSLDGGSDAPELLPPPSAAAWRTLRAPTARGEAPARIVIDAAGSDAVRLFVQARGIGMARAVVRVGDFVVRDVLWDVALRTADANRWTVTQSFRVPLPVGARRVVIEALAGEIAVTATGHRKRTDLLDFIPRHRDRLSRVEALLEALPTPAANEVFQRLGQVMRTASARDAEAALKRALAPDVPPPLRTLVLVEAVRWARTPEEALDAAERAFQATASLPSAVAAPLRRMVLEHLVAAHADPAPGPQPWTLALPMGAHDDDLAALAALSSAISPPLDGKRPSAAPAADRYAWIHGDLEAAAARARQTWVREAPWATIDPPPGAATWNELDVPIDTLGNPRCRVVGGRGLRWTVLPEGRTPIVVSAPQPATHARVLVVPYGTEPLPESSLLVDGTAFTAHTGAGLGSVAAVAAGPRVFERPAGAPPLLAHIPRDGDAPCATLREATRWLRLNGRATFTLPGVGRATVGRVVVYAAEAPLRKPRVVRVFVGERVYEAWVSGSATGAVEFEVPRDVGEISVETEEETMVRFSARLHPRARPAPRVTAPAGVPPSPEAIELLLARVRAATRTLNEGAPEERVPSRRKRALALEELGYPALALFDRDGDASLEPIDDRDTNPPAGLILSTGSPTVVPLGFVPRVPPLPLPDKTEPLARARRAESVSDPGTALAALMNGGADKSSDADALLLAVLAERTGAGWIAAEALERIGLSHRSGAALARAAALGADRAAEEQDRARALRSFVLAQVAVDHGDPAAVAFARLAPAIAFQSVVRADSVAGTGLVDFRGARQPVPLNLRVRRALLDAPDDALLLTEGQHVEIRVQQTKKTTVTIDTRCRALEPDPACQLSVALDGLPAACGEPSASITGCTLDLAPGRHSIDVRGPRGRTTIGSARISGGGGFAFEARVVSEWFEIDADRPLELTFAAPTVVRLEARGPAGEARHLSWSVDPPVPVAAVTSQGQLTLDPAPDPAAKQVGGDPNTLLSLGAALEKRIAVLADGPHKLRVTSPEGRVLLRVQLAVPIGLPRPRAVPPGAPDETPDKVSPDDPARRGPPVVFDPDGGIGLIGGYMHYTNADVGDEDNLTSVSQLEAGLWFRRELVPLYAWLSASPFVRIRPGEPSFGLAGWFDVAPKGILPGIFLRGRVVGEPVPGSFGLGARGQLGVHWTVPVADSVVILPWGGIALLHTDPTIAGRQDADREIYTPYSDQHPRYGMLGLRTYLRPTLDAVVNIGLSGRTTPDFADIDRVDLEAAIDLLPGRGFWPWINLNVFNSYRPESAYRKTAFLRSGVSGTLTFWSWISAGHRLSAGLEGRILVDMPRTHSPFRLSTGAFLSYDFTGGRGLRDLPPREASFRARLEEGSGRIDRRQTSVDPTWGPPP